MGIWRKPLVVLAGLLGMLDSISGCSSGGNTTTTKKQDVATTLAKPVTTTGGQSEGSSVGLTGLVITCPHGFKTEPTDSGDNRTGEETLKEEAASGPENGNISSLRQAGWLAGYLRYCSESTSSKYASESNSIEIDLSKFQSGKDASSYSALEAKSAREVVGAAAAGSVPGISTSSMTEMRMSSSIPPSYAVTFYGGEYAVSIVTFNATGTVTRGFVDSISVAEYKLLDG